MAGIYCLASIGDKGFDAGWLCERLRANDMEAVIPLGEGTSGYAEHDREKYKWRHLVENKAFRRTVTRYEKTDKMLRRHHQPRRHSPLDKVNVNRP
jgi:hypothetical protein